MKKKLLIFVSYAMLHAASLSAQCPDRDALWTRLRNLRYSKLPPSVQLAELLSTRDSMKNCSYRNDSTHIYLLRKIADIYFKEKDYISAVQYRRQAIEVTAANAAKPSVKLKDLPGIYYYLSVTYDSLNNYQEKMKALDSCSAIAMRLHYVDKAVLIALYTRVEYYFDIGDYHRCIDYAIKCQLLAREYANQNTGSEKVAGEGYASSSLGWHVNALLNLKKFELAEEILTTKIEEYKKAGLKDYMGLVYGQLAETQEQKGNFKEALGFYNESLRCYQDIKDNFNCKQTLKDIGYKIYFKNFNDGDKALAYYRKGLKYINGDKFSKTADDFESLNIFSNIGAVFVQKGLYDSAFKYFQLAFDQVKPGSNEDDIVNSTPQEMMRFKRNYYLTGLLINKADAFRRQYGENNQKKDIEKAVSIYKVADQLLDKIKSEQTELESKLFWRSDTRRLYENAIESCYLSKNATDAFYFFEKSRSVLLQDQLSEQQWMDEASILKQTQIKKLILHLEREYDTTGKSSKRYKELESERFIQKQELARVQQEIKANNPLYFQNYLDTSRITLDQVNRKVLRDHNALIEFFAGDSAVYSLIITGNDVQLNRIKKNSFDSLTALFIKYISNASLQNKYFPEFIKVSSQLYQLLFPNNSLPSGRIIISTDGRHFPFEALVTKAQPLTYFLGDHAVSYTYSARFLTNDFIAGSGTTGKVFMGVAPVNYRSTFSLVALPGSDQSLHKIAGYFDNAVSQVADEASRTNFMRQFSQYRIIQLYTHAADSSSNNEPVIYFADSALYLSDLISEFRPHTRLIVLSACETGTGRIYEGEGVFSFNRGFAALGVPAAISNLWSVDNGSTYLLTELFYKWLSEGLTTDVALQKAKLEFLETASREKSMPFYWAGPVLVGKTDLIELKDPDTWKWIAVLAGVGMIIFWVGREWALPKKWRKK